ncbi:hypothetical protein GCM10018785_06420 [Streptomyces longispororuber]|uniref:Uncharacterized protein n=1 Tax=Streptomyces longispororuber TaxID=68230 RepID=A0A918Z9I8_9ACTN|nr:hypothetical protein [Streptomyces longispororuber]GHE39516.1 hypothetical protein GCM10018785_06420 [Streptomyces longispororuber]
MAAEENRPRPVNSPAAGRTWRPRHRAVAAAVAVGLLGGAAGGLGAHLLWPGDPGPGPGGRERPSATATAGPVAAPIRAAMLDRRRVGVDVVARTGGDPGSFTGQARLDLRGATTARAATHVLYDMGEGHAWHPPEVVLIGNRAVITPAGEMTGPAYGPAGSYRTEPDATAAAADDTAVRNALETRWLAQPAHLVALLDGATALRTDRARGPRTLTGTTPLRALAAAPAVGPLYRPYAAEGRPGAAVRFTLVVAAGELPRSLRTEVPSGSGDDVFRVEYRDWARGGPITARPGPTPAPQWTTARESNGGSPG